MTSLRRHFKGFQILVILIAFVIGPASQAAKTKKKQAQPAPKEVFVATEPDESIVDNGVVEPTVIPSAPKKNAPAKTVVAARVKAAPALVVQGQFDSVPNDQLDPIIHRLKLVEELIQKYGRAYDYRTHTVRDLEVILAQLDAAHTPQAPATDDSGPAPSTDDSIHGI